LILLVNALCVDWYASHDWERFALIGHTSCGSVLLRNDRKIRSVPIDANASPINSSAVPDRGFAAPIVRSTPIFLPECVTGSRSARSASINSSAVPDRGFAAPIHIPPISLMYIYLNS
jgi:hypothetical protein